jgi:hypothetical protein
MPSEPRFDEQWVRAFGQDWDIMDVPASVWLTALRRDHDRLAGVFPGLINDGCVDSMLRVWLDFDDAGDRCERAARKLLGRAAGLDWVWAFNLMRLCLRGWLFVNGMLLRQGVNASRMPLSDWLMAAYTLIYEGRDEAGRLALESELSTPPAGVRLLIPAAIQHQGAMAFALD